MLVLQCAYHFSVLKNYSYSVNSLKEIHTYVSKKIFKLQFLIPLKEEREKKKEFRLIEWKPLFTFFQREPQPFIRSSYGMGNNIKKRGITIFKRVGAAMTSFFKWIKI